MRYFISLFLYYSLGQYIPERYKINKLGSAIRRSLCRNIFAHCGSGLNCRTRVFFGYGKRLYIGDRSSIGKFSRLYLDDNIYIGDNTDIGPWSIIYTADLSPKSAKSAPVKIKNDVWIGARCTILQGVIVGEGTIIGAGSVVYENIPPYSIAGGNPAKVIRSRLIDSKG